MLRGARRAAPDFVVNGRLRPVVQMQPGEVQLWRIANTAGRSAAYFQAPVGLQWRQIAQDGVQFANQNYRGSQNRPIYVAPGNRIDLLVQAPTQPMTANVAGPERHGARRRQADTGKSDPERSQSRHAPAVGRGVGRRR